MREALTSVINDGLGRTDALLPGHGFFDFNAGLTQDMIFGRAEVGAKLRENISAFGFGQVQKDFHRPDAEFMAGLGLKVDF